MTAVEIALASHNDRAVWDDYLARAKDAALFHDWRWGDAVSDGFGYETLRLIARRDGRVAGLLPLIDVRSALFGRSLISTAFAIGGGALADDDETLFKLGEKALELGRERRVNYVELRGGVAPGAEWRAKAGLYAAFSKPLPAHVDDILRWLPKNRRSEVRKAIELLTSGETRSRLDGTPEEFHALYAAAVRNLGTPVFSILFVRALVKHFSSDAEIALIERGGKPVATLLSFRFRDLAMPYYIGGAPEARALKAYDYLYYWLMRRSIERGAKIFDFGRSKIGSSHYQTKTYWGFEPRPLVYHVALVRAKSLPNVSPNNPKFAAMSTAWRRLPLPIANAAGPLLARHFA